MQATACWWYNFVMPKKKLQDLDKPVTRRDLLGVTDTMQEIAGFIMKEMKKGFSQIRKEFSKELKQIYGVRSELKTEVQGVRGELKQQIQGVRTELKEQIQGVRGEFKQEIQGLRGELKEEIQGLRGELKGDIKSIRTEIADFRLEEKLNWEDQRRFNQEILEKVELNQESIVALDKRVRYQDDLPERLEHVENQQYELTRRVVALEK